MVWWPPYLQECNRKLYLIFEIAQKFLISGLCHYYYSYLNPNVFVVVLSWSFKMLLFFEVIFLLANFIFLSKKNIYLIFFEEDFLKKKIIVILIWKKSLLRIPFFLNAIILYKILLCFGQFLGNNFGMHREDLKNDICGKEIDCRNFIYAWIEFLEYLELWYYIFKVRIVQFR